MMAFFLAIILIIPLFLGVAVWRLFFRRPLRSLVVYGGFFLLATLGVMAALAAFQGGWWG